MDPQLHEALEQRDQYRFRALNAEARVKELEMLLRYAEEALVDEYRLRIAVSRQLKQRGIDHAR